MIRIICVYFPFAKATLKSEYLVYKSRFFLWSVANTVMFVAQLFLWKAIYENSLQDVLHGYTYDEMIVYVGISKIVECLSFVSMEGNVSKGVRDGSISSSLIKPINYRIELLFRSLGQIIGSTLLFLPLYIATFMLFVKVNSVSVDISFFDFLLASLFLIIAFGMNYCISLIFSCVVFKTIKSTGIYQLKKTIITFLSGALFPISFYPESFRGVLNYLPFAYLRYYPTVTLQGKLSMQESLFKLVLGLLWLFLLLLLSSKLWDKMIKKLIVFGGG